LSQNLPTATIKLVVDEATDYLNGNTTPLAPIVKITVFFDKHDADGMDVTITANYPRPAASSSVAEELVDDED
jgi:hypothetical protein